MFGYCHGKSKVTGVPQCPSLQLVGRAKEKHTFPFKPSSVKRQIKAEKRQLSVQKFLLSTTLSAARKSKMRGIINAIQPPYLNSATSTSTQSIFTQSPSLGKNSHTHPVSISLGKNSHKHFDPATWGRKTTSTSSRPGSSTPLTSYDERAASAGAGAGCTSRRSACGTRPGSPQRSARSPR